MSIPKITPQDKARQIIGLLDPEGIADWPDLLGILETSCSEVRREAALVVWSSQSRPILELKYLILLVRDTVFNFRRNSYVWISTQNGTTGISLNHG
ncbi:hypothetical protein KJ782_04545 [Patescibacteria group bacterium]|nr:hypothetical protein [Patescibacteria group bacterium]